ncbi:M48 family metallopeptidase [Kitasatospora sp. MAP5-34]|uniref:M48 family metallopeptidase n=1 Tax=Kitasatospora sp. MAP5-34 TaxID=3035102 RepID=UPI0024748E2E|nr:M48 family metallopeptidase [Kitasatospora sp. MAP5-34]MDH6576220.1 Zn-dependent protease with chaperone function [Kitasatospora sp. MAP5-34]
MSTTPLPDRHRPGLLSSSVRAALAVALLLGFYLLALGILAAVVGLDVVLAEGSRQPFGIGALKVYALSAAVCYPVLRVVFLSRRPKADRDGPPGLLVTPEQQPALWARVRRLTELTGTREPAEIRLIPVVNAAVSERTRLLGLLPGRRTLHVGVPLLLGLSEAEFDAVLAHEIGHYSNQDVRLAGLNFSTRRAVQHTVDGLNRRAARRKAEQAAVLKATAAARVAKGRKPSGGRATGGLDQALAGLFTAYAKLYFRVSESVSRRQEYAADRAAARIAGRDATASALRAIPVLDSAYDVYLGCYALLGWDAGLLPFPGEVYGGFARLLADPERRVELADLRDRLPYDEADPYDPYDSHPPIAARVAAIEALPPDGRGPDGSGPALALLTRPGQTLAAVEQATLDPAADAKARLDWPELANRTGSARYIERAEQLRLAARSLGLPGTLAGVLEALTLGHAWELADQLPKTARAQVVTGRAAREFARPVLRRALSDLILLSLIEAGLAHWEFSWSRPMALRLPDGVADALPAALDAAVADSSDPAGLRALAALLPLPASAAPRRT